MIEIWEDIKGFDGMYQISNLANVKTFQPRYKIPRILKPGLAGNGYLTVHLKGTDGTRKSYCIHRLMCETFIPHPGGNMWVNHKDGNKINNSLDNLEWLTPGQNNSHAIRTGLKRSVIPARGVIQMDMEGNEIARYHSSEHVPNASSGNVCHVANGKRNHHRGFRYKWAN